MRWVGGWGVGGVGGGVEAVVLSGASASPSYGCPLSFQLVHA